MLNYIIISCFFQYFTIRIETAELKKMEEKAQINGYANGSVPDCGESAEGSNKTGHAIIKSSTVSGDDLVLMPNGNGEDLNSKMLTTTIPRNRSFDSLKREFELGDCLDFVHAGMEAIIEDEVTQRFVAEELKVCSFLFNILMWASRN